MGPGASGGLFSTRANSVHNCYCDLYNPLLYSVVIFPKSVTHNHCELYSSAYSASVFWGDYFNAEIDKSAVLSALDVQKVPTVQRFVPKSADSAVLFCWNRGYCVEGVVLRKTGILLLCLYKGLAFQQSQNSRQYSTFWGFRFFHISPLVTSLGTLWNGHFP